MIVHRLTERPQDVDVMRDSLYPPPGTANPLFHCRRLRLARGQATPPHDHHDAELWIVIRGEGAVSVDGHTHNLRSGDAIRLAPLGRHSMRNTSATDDLVFVALWWDDMNALAQEHARRRIQGSSAQKKTWIMPAFVTPNGDLHVGHLSGPYIAGDIFRRAAKLSGRDVTTMLGTLGHMNYVTVAARKRGETFYETAEYFSKRIETTFEAYRIDSDVFLGPTPTETYAKLVQDMFRVLKERGIVYLREGVLNYCEECAAFCTEAFLVGTCPVCGSGSSGAECESCGQHHDDSELLDARCTRCQRRTVPRSTARFYLRLEAVRGELERFFASVTAEPRLKGYIASIMARKLPEIAVSHPSEDGISLPEMGFYDQRIYSSFEGAARFLAAVQMAAERESPPRTWRRYLTEESIELVVFFGFDNAFKRAFLFPALMLGFVGELCLPSSLIMNQFYRLDGLKFSTSRNHAVWADELLRYTSADAVRFYLAKTRPENEEANFTREDFFRCVRDELVGGWQAWIQSVQTRLTQYFGDHVPEAGPWSAEASEFYEAILTTRRSVARALSPTAFSPRRAVRELSSFVHGARHFGDTVAGLLEYPQRSREADTHMALELMAVATIAELADPIMPWFAERLRAALGDDQIGAPDSWQRPPRWLPVGITVANLARQLFDDCAGPDRVDRLADRTAAAS